jgi:predicted TPR repeat methyltransferase
LLRPFARTLIGVDLSEKMVARAKDLESEGQPLYDELVVDELTAFFAQRRATYDVVISADTLCYFGNLQPPVNALAGALTPGGLLGFTVERAEHAVDGYLLCPHGRYSQTESYVKGVVQSAGLQVALCRHVHLRVEKGEAVEGLLVLAQASPVVSP